MRHDPFWLSEGIGRRKLFKLLPPLTRCERIRRTPEWTRMVWRAQADQRQILRFAEAPLQHDTTTAAFRFDARGLRR